jgi:drug/metabolite transporter (DMT)-like permease
MSKAIKAHISLLVVNLIYGANYSIVKFVSPHFIQPYGLVLIRAGVTFMLFMVTGFFLPGEKIERKYILRLALLGVCGVAVNQMLFIKGLVLGSAINASVIMMLNPIIVMLIEVIFLRQKAPLLKIIGIILGISGSVTLFLMRHGFSLRGDIMVLFNCISWAVYLVTVRPLMVKYRTVTVVKWVFAFGFIYVLPFSWGEFSAFNYQAMTTMAWCGLAFIVLGSTFIAYFLNTYALRELSASVASAYIYLQPLIAVILAISLGQDKLDVYKVMSALLIIAGIAFVSFSYNGKKVVVND